MGLLERIFGGGRAETEKEPDSETMTINRAHDLLERRREETARELMENAKPKYSEMQRCVTELEGAIKNLAGAQHSEDVDKDAMNQRILSAAMAGRRNFIERMNSMTRDLRKPMGDDMDSVISFVESSVAILKNVNSTAFADYRFFGELFRKESSVALDSFKRLAKLSGELGRTIEPSKKGVDDIGLCKSELKNIQSSIASYRGKKSGLNDAERKIMEMKGDEERLKKDILNISTSDEAKDFERMALEKEEVQMRMSRVTSEAAASTSPLEKAVKKFKKSIEDGEVSFGNKRFVNVFLENPADAVLGDAESFTSLLKALRANMGKLELKERSAKTLEIVESLLSSDFPKKISGDIKLLSGKLSDVEDKISKSSIQERINRLKSELESMNRKITEAEAELPKERASLERLAGDISSKKSGLEQKLSRLLGKNVKLSGEA